jgi:hypothetical protein
MRGRTQNFDFERRTYDQLKLIYLQDTVFNSNRFQVPFGFNFCWIEWFSKFILLMHMHMQNHDNDSPIRSSQKENFTTYRRHAYNMWQIALILVVSSSDLTYEVWLAYLQKSIIYL